MQKIILENIRIYAYHGCLKEENIIGSEYQIDLLVYGKFDENADFLSNTIDYSILLEIIKEEMNIRSNLIEHVAERILNRLKTIEKIKKAKIKLSKLNPPLSADIDKVSVVFKYKN